MRKGLDLERRLRQVAALQSLKATASRAELAEANLLRAEAESELADRQQALDAGAAEMQLVLASDVLDFDRWRIGRAVLDNLTTAHKTAGEEVSRCELEERNARSTFGRENARKDRARALHLRQLRKLNEKRDDTATLEACGLVTARKSASSS